MEVIRFVIMQRMSRRRRHDLQPLVFATIVVALVVMEAVRRSSSTRCDLLTTFHRLHAKEKELFHHFHRQLMAAGAVEYVGSIVLRRHADEWKHVHEHEHEHEHNGGASVSFLLNQERIRKKWNEQKGIGIESRTGQCEMG